MTALPPVRAVSPLHGKVAVAGIAVAVAISVDLHLRLSGQVSPIWQTLSEYVYGRFDATDSAAPLFNAMCLALALGSLALLAGIVKARRPRAVPALLGLWCTGLAVCAAFPVDPHGQARSFSGQVHNYAALLAFLALPAAAWILTRRTNAECPWEPRRTTIRRLAVASALVVGVLLGSFLFQLASGDELTMGLFERILFTIDLMLLLTMVRPLLERR